MSKFIIQGGCRISGSHKVPGNKNAALPMLAACVLTDQPVTLQNVPLIRDVRTMLDILDDLGADVELHGHSVTVRCGSIRKRRLNVDLCSSARSSILFAGPMLARFGRVTVSPPGGDVIGRRRLDTHFDGLAQLGVEMRLERDYMMHSDALHGADILLDEASVTATENIVMAAVLADGRTTIFNAACEPHVQDLCRMLNRMGADIAGIGTNLLTINGVERLGGTRHRIASDYIEAASFIAAAALTGGALQVEDVLEQDFKIIEKVFSRLGVRWKIKDGVLHLPAGQSLEVSDDIGAAIPKIEDGTWPNFPSDLMSVSLVLATQAKGSLLFFEKLFESRMYFVDRLIGMGARIIQCDPHRVVVNGPSRLIGTRMSSPDIRAGMALLLAALCSKGESIIGNAGIIDRGYENVDAELRRLGADIQRVGK
jgi:UDP-N-acetylglucosamine 1-carboxyvinyltransferase